MEPNEDTPWPTGLDEKQQLVQLASTDKATISVVAENNTDDEIRLQNRTVLGRIYAVGVVKNVEEKATCESQNQNRDLSNNGQVKPCQRTTMERSNESKPQQLLWDPSVNLSHLTSEQQQKVRHAEGRE